MKISHYNNYGTWRVATFTMLMKSVSTCMYYKVDSIDTDCFYMGLIHVKGVLFQAVMIPRHQDRAPGFPCSCGEGGGMV